MATGLSQTDAGSSSGGVITISPPVSGQATMSVVTADVPPNSLVYGRTVAINDVITYDTSVTRDGSGIAAVSVDTLGVPTLSGAYGTYPLPFTFDGGGNETYIYAHKNDSVILSAFSLPVQDAEGYSIFTPSATSRLLYVDDTGGNDATAGPNGDSTDYYVLSTLPVASDWEGPGAVNAYKTIAAAYADVREGEDDWVLAKRGETFTFTARQTINHSGKSSTERAMIIAYGVGARPIIRGTAALANDFIFRISSDANIGFVGLNFYESWRDPSHIDFVGYGGLLGGHTIQFLSLSVACSGNIVENCEFQFMTQGISFTGGFGIASNNILRRNIFRSIYDETDTTEPLFASSAEFLIEENLFDYGGWLIDRDAVTYPSGSAESGTHTGGTSSTILTDSGQSSNWATADWTGVVVNNDSTGASGIISASTSTTATVTLTGGSRQDWQNGDTYSLIDVTKTHGQATDFNHDLYLSDCDNSIIRNNIICRGAAAGIKFTSNPADAAEELAGYYATNLIVHDNVFIDHEYGLSWGGNNDFEVNTRYRDSRFMDNVLYKIGHSNHTGKGLSQGAWIYDWEDGCVGGNILTINGVNRGLWNGMNCNEHMNNTIFSRNIFYNLGDASGTPLGTDRGAMVFNAAADVYTNLQILNNEIQMQGTDAPIYGDWPSGSDVTFSGNVYDSLKTNPYEIDEVASSYTTWLTASGETGSSEATLAYTEARTIETYQTSLTATATIDAFIIDASAMMAPGSWNNDYEAAYIVQYFKEGYRV